MLFMIPVQAHRFLQLGICHLAGTLANLGKSFFLELNPGDLTGMLEDQNERGEHKNGTVIEPKPVPPQLLQPAAEQPVPALP